MPLLGTLIGMFISGIVWGVALPVCRGAACRTLFAFIVRPNQEGTASRTPTHCRVALVKIFGNGQFGVEGALGRHLTR